MGTGERTEFYAWAKTHHHAQLWDRGNTTINKYVKMSQRVSWHQDIFSLKYVFQEPD